MRYRIHERVQHPVGQGFFHSGCVDGANGTLHYVVDCGSMSKYSAARRASVRSYISFMKKTSHKRRLDVLFITHLHIDHVSGLEELLDPRGGLRVDTIVMPLVNDIDRLILLAKSYTDDRASADSEFYRAFVTDPGVAASRFNPRRVLFVRSGGGDGGAPAGADVPFDPFDPDLVSRLGERQIWKFAGRGRITRYPDDARLGPRDESGMLIVPDTIAAAISSEIGTWLLAPYVDSGVSRDRARFLNALARERRMSVPRLKAWLDSRDNLESLIKSDISDLVAAYNAIAADLNVTSLCLYSGPADTSSKHLYDYWYTAGKPFQWRWYERSPVPAVGWLGTGDADLLATMRRKDFLSHYGRLLANVATLTLPHHGSERNFHEELLKKIRPRLSVASADRYSNWRHPGAHVVQAVCSHGAAIHVVTSTACSRLHECVYSTLT